MELTDRKKQILKIVTEEYIRSAEPIGSKAIAQQMPGKISSATIRNELADLVEMGYLEQPHTSAGRVPSAKGYRLYVNELMEHRTVSGEEAEKITSALDGQMKQLDQVVAQAGQMASSLMGYPAYAVADHKQAVTVQRFELIAVSDDSFIAVVMLSDSRVKSQLMHLQLQVDLTQWLEEIHSGGYQNRNTEMEVHILKFIMQTMEQLRQVLKSMESPVLIMDTGFIRAMCTQFRRRGC